VRKLLNDPFAVVDEMIDGLVAAYPSQIEVTPSRRGVVSTARNDARRVGIVTGGGSGHEPAFWGYLGPGYADGAALGNVFASPSATPIVEVAERVDRGDGVLFLYGNYDGDVMNFEMAGELLAERGVRVLQLATTDDLVSSDRREHRRGVAGNVLVLKVAGARADEGASLDDVHAVATHANDRTRTIGIGLGPCTVPAAGRPTFELPEGMMDVGMGIHGEAGISRRALAPADEVADELLDLLLAELEPAAGESMWVLVNTLGATPPMEGLVVLRRVTQQLTERGIPVHRARVGEYITSLEMAGLSLTLMCLDDDLRRLGDAPGRALAMPPLDEPW
jgi:phosphoenolpyruvate---glycerone phosphotransferase subunit DhaK